MSGTTDRYEHSLASWICCTIGMSSNVWCFFNLALFWQESHDHGVTEGDPCGWVHDHAESSLCFWEGDGLISECRKLVPYENLLVDLPTIFIYVWSSFNCVHSTFSHDDQFGEKNQKTGRGMNGKFFFLFDRGEQSYRDFLSEIKRIKF